MSSWNVVEVNPFLNSDVVFNLNRIGQKFFQFVLQDYLVCGANV